MSMLIHVNVVLTSNLEIEEKQENKQKEKRVIAPFLSNRLTVLMCQEVA